MISIFNIGAKRIVSRRKAKATQAKARFWTIISDLERAKTQCDRGFSVVV